MESPTAAHAPPSPLQAPPASLSRLPPDCQQRIANALPARDMLSLGQTCRSWRALCHQHPELRAALAWPDPALCVTARTLARKCAEMDDDAWQAWARLPYFYARPDAYQERLFGSLYPLSLQPSDMLRGMAHVPLAARVDWLIEQREALRDRLAAATAASGWVDPHGLSANDRRFRFCPQFATRSEPSELSRIGSLLLARGIDAHSEVVMLSGLDEDDEETCDTPLGLQSDGSGAATVLALVKDADFGDPCHHWVRVLPRDLFAQNGMLVEALWQAALTDGHLTGLALSRGYDPFAQGMFNGLDLPATLWADAPAGGPSHWPPERLLSWHLLRRHGYDVQPPQNP